ncbi:MAG: WD40/YVTN/BNR-like repeat-containing protein, partial [Candidatus Aenigmatarchaeota archaeon]
MKKILIILFILIISSTVNSEEYAVWLHPSLGVTLDDVEFLNENEGWMVGTPGFMFHTTDGGTNWEKIETNFMNQLHSICVVNSDTIFAVGFEGTLLKTIDGGECWEIEQIENEDWSYLQDIYFINPEVGFIVGTRHGYYYSEIWKTTDGGETWTQEENTYYPSSLYALSFNNAQTGWAVGVNPDNTGIIYHTIDAGEMWTQYQQTDFGIYNIFFLDEVNGWICGKNQILRTNDGGEIWHPTQTNFVAEEFWDVYFQNENQGWAVSWCQESGLTDKGRIYETNDGGITWTLNYQTESGITNYFSSITAIDSKIWACGDGVILHSFDNGLNWNFQSENISNAIFSSITVNEDYVHILGTETTGSPILFLSDNYGDNFTSVDSFPIDYCADVDFINEEIGWIAGKNSIVKTMDGGYSWDLLFEPQTDEIYYLIDFVDSLNGWVFMKDFAEEESKILHTENGGENWIEQIEVQGGHGSFPFATNALRFLNTNIGWFFGDEGAVWRTTNGGDEWEEVTSVTDVIGGGCIEPISTQEAWVGGDYFQVFHTTNGGQSWERNFLSNGLGYVVDIRFQGDIGFAIAWNYTSEVYPFSYLYKTIDGGETWTKFDPPVVISLNNLYIKDDDLFIVGSYGVILRYNDIVSTGVYDE